MTPRDESVGRVLVALAEPTRRALLEVLAARPSASATVLARELPISRQAILKHLAVLTESGLVASARSGRELLFHVRPQPLQQTATWLQSLADSWDDRLADLKRRAESD